MYGHTGPVIQEVLENPNEGGQVVQRADQQNWRHDHDVLRLGREAQKLMSNPDFNTDPDLMEEAISLFENKVAEWRADQGFEGWDHRRQEKIEFFQQRVVKFKEQRKRACDRYYDERDSKIENSRRERVRDVHQYTDNNISNFGNSTRLNQHSHRQSYTTREDRYHTSEDEENIPVQHHRTRAPSSYSNYTQSTMQQRRDDSNVHYRSHQSAAGPSSSQQVRMRSGKSRVTKTRSRKWRPGQKALSEIRKYQKSTDMLIHKAPFARLVHEIIQGSSLESKDFRIRADALMALQEAAEAFMVEMFEGSALICNHAKRVTLMPTDIQLYRRLCLRNL